MKIVPFLKSAVVFCLVAFTFSCESDSSADEDFFNINIGNEWVYKRYDNSPANPDVLTFTGTDSVKVQEIVTAEGISFSKLQHRHFNASGLFSHVSYEFLRINDTGRLIGFDSPDGDIETSVEFPVAGWGHVMHPGEDFSFTQNDNYPLNELIPVFRYVTEQIDMTVEGNNYTVIPYKGDFITPGETATKTVEFDYEAQTGLVRSVTYHLQSTNFYEMRLVSATIID